MKKLIGNLNLDHGPSEGQALYHSQLYGTFFGVYAFIESEANGDERVITSMKLQVINYKGVLNMGIDKATYNEGDECLHLEMRAMSNNIDDINVEGIDQKSFKKSDRLIVKRYLKPIHSEKSTTEVPLKDGVFDSEFHYREGIIDGQKTILPEQSKDYAGGRPTEPQGAFIGESVSGWFCPYAELILIWL